LVSEAEALRREFDVTRQELDEMSAEIVSVEEQMSGFARQDLQVGGLRVMMENTRRRHAHRKRAPDEVCLGHRRSAGSIALEGGSKLANRRKTT
jgi:hypothetical protein